MPTLNYTILGNADSGLQIKAKGSLKKATKVEIVGVSFMCAAVALFLC